MADTVCLTRTNTQTRLPAVASEGCGGGPEKRWVQGEERWVKEGGEVGKRGLCSRPGGYVWLWGKKKKRTLPLFIKLRQIQLACGLPSNPINLLSCESTQQLLPISHFSWLLIRSAGDIPWGSLQLHHRRYSCSRPRRPAWSASSSFSLNLFNFPPFLLPASPPPSTCHLHPIFPPPSPPSCPTPPSCSYMVTTKTTRTVTSRPMACFLPDSDQGAGPTVWQEGKLIFLITACPQRARPDPRD